MHSAIVHADLWRLAVVTVNDIQAPFGHSCDSNPETDVYTTTTPFAHSC